MVRRGYNGRMEGPRPGKSLLASSSTKAETRQIGLAKRYIKWVTWCPGNKRWDRR
jgi:hypothetical protein